ncbi:MAG: TPM domain-containing protein [Clostridia bacterium]|nr:TPM domain-containing protein [Clostridia bacterium]
MKKVLLIPLLILALALPLMNAFAEDPVFRDRLSDLPAASSIAAPSRTGLVTDETGNLTSREIEALEGTCREIGDKYGLTVMIRLVNRTPGYTQSDSDAGYYGLRQYAADYYDARHSGEDGIIFSVRLSDRWYVSVTTGRGERAMTTARLDACEDAAKTYLRSGRYYDAFSAYLKKLVNYLDRYWDQSSDPSGWEPEPPTIYGGGHTARQPADPKTRLVENLPIIGIVSAAITAIVLLCVRHSMRTARKKEDAGNYISQARITGRQDLYLYTSQTRRRIQTSSSSSSGHSGHGGGGHFGGGGGHGSSHGGRF